MTWVRIDEEFAQHPKIMQAGPLAMAMQVAALCYSNRNLTDGFIPWSVSRTLLSWEFLGAQESKGSKRFRVAVVSGMSGDDVTSDFVIEQLMAAEIWEEVAGGYQIHDFEDYQPTKEQVLKERTLKQAAGQAGGIAAAIARATAAATANGTAPALAKSKPVPVPVPVPVSEEEEEEEAARDPRLACLVTAYENCLGLVPVNLYDDLKSVADAVPMDRHEEIITDVFHEAAEYGARSWRYVSRIFEDWGAKGWPSAAARNAQRSQTDHKEKRSGKSQPIPAAANPYSRAARGIKERKAGVRVPGREPLQPDAGRRT